MEMTMEEVKAVATKLGLSFNSNIKKQDLVEMVNNNIEENSKEEDKDMEMEIEMESISENEDAAEEILELELDGDDLSEMEEIVKEKVKQEEKENQKNKSKRGPKPNSSNEKENRKDKKEKSKPKDKKKIDINDKRVIESQIKKGKISAPCFRIEKNEVDKTYDLLMAPGVIFSSDAKYEKYGNTKKMVDGKWMVTMKAVEVLGTEKFKARTEDGQELEHDYVRFELHKPGRDKDVVELMSVREAKSRAHEANKKLEEKKKKQIKEEGKEVDAV